MEALRSSSKNIFSARAKPSLSEVTVSRSAAHAATVEAKVKLNFLPSLIQRGIGGKKKRLHYSAAFSAVKADRSAYLCVTTWRFHAVSLFVALTAEKALLPRLGLKSAAATIRWRFACPTLSICSPSSVPASRRRVNLWLCSHKARRWCVCVFAAGIWHR